ncbi:A-kinase anchor protein 12 isoform X2 [Petaurus breviceps papuanus]|uniref:A-kinase anchor protein 12 isoform X2 n=1 Tax=Petaurus breviceps papuanus TaxID=3040969 RepID=UPI0036DE60BF
MLGTITITVGQRDSENMTEKDVDNTLIARSSSSVQDVQETVHEIIEQMPLSENNIEGLEQPTESQSNDVGFKKVFKFVGFKFTVKKDKNDKSDPVELLTVKKDEDDDVETNGADEYQDSGSENGTLPKETESTQLVGTDEESQRDSADPEEGKSSEEEKQEKGNKSSESESISSFRKFFSLGWAGWRKKTSFRKSKEEEPEISEKKKEQEVGKGDMVEISEGKKEDTTEQSAVSEHVPPQEAIESIKDSNVSENEKVHRSPEDEVQEAHITSEEKVAPLATEVFDEKVETVAEVHVSTVEEQEQTEDQSAKVEQVVGSLFLATIETNADLQKAEVSEKLVKNRELICASGDDYIKLVEPIPEESALCQQYEGITNEVEILSSQERGRLQGSPLKKLFTGTSLKKLSGKKHKGKRGDGEIKPEESGELTQVSVDSPETPEEQKGESSASSPEELTEVTCVEKDIVEAPQEVEIEEEGTTSDGERKREGVTPWASFKKMVTPKKRVRRLSESDKEDEVKEEKVKSATLSSTESAVSDNQDEMKGHGDDQKTEEPKRKVDTSVSWEALICVGSSKKRARKSSSSDEEGGSKVVSGDSQKTEDTGKNKESGTEITHIHSHEGDQGQINSSPELAGSPLEGEGVSTWVSFKRLVTPRKKSKSKMEERNEDSVTIPGIEHSASDVEPVKEESWVSIKKLIPGRRKKRLDGKQEQIPVEEDHTGVNEDDSDIPAVVPLSEYDAAEQEKIEAQQAKNTEVAKTSQHEMKSGQVEGPGTEETVEGLVHAVSVTVVEGERAITSIEERSPSWISAKIIEPVEEATDQAKQQSEEILEKEVLVEVPITKTLPDIKDTSSDTIVSELELTCEAVTAPEEAAEITEASCAEETTEMVSAVSQLTDSPDSTEEATPVQEVEDDTPDLEALKQRTQEVIQAVIEKVKQSEESEITATVHSGDILLADQSPENLEAKIPKEVNAKKAEQSGDHQEINLEIGEAAGLDDSKVVDTEEQEEVQAATSEDLAVNDRQQELIEQTSSETFNNFNEVERSIEVKECKSYSDFTTYQAETTGIETPQIPMEQITPVEIGADEGTLVVHFEDIKQQEGSDVGDAVPALGSAIMERTVVTVSSDKPLESPGFQSSQGNKEQSKVEVPPSTEEQIVVQMVQNLSGTEVVQDSGPFVDQEVKDTITAKEQVSLHTDVMDQIKIDQVELKDKKIPEEDKLEYKNSSEKVELQISSYSASVEGEVLVQEQVVSSEVLKVQSSETQEASLPLTAAAVVEKAVAEAVNLSETSAENLDSVNVQLVAEKIPSGSIQHSDTAWSDQVVLTEKQSLTESGIQEKAKTVKVSAITETIKSSDFMKRPEEESQKLLDAASVEVVSQEVKPTLTQVEPGKDEDDILTIKTQSTRIVQNVIQTAVDQLVSAKDLNTQTFILNAEEQSQIRKPEEEEGTTIHVSERNESELIAQCEIKSVTTENLGPVAVEQTPDAPVISDIYKEVSVSEGSETIVAIEVQIPELKLGEQQHDEAAPQLEEKEEAIETKSEPKIDSTTSGEVPDKSKHVPKGETEDDTAIDHSDDPKLVPGESSDLCKESIDSNGPKLKETVQGLECQERLVLQVEKEIYNQSVEHTKTQTQEEVHKHDEPCESPPKSAPKES